MTVELWSDEWIDHFINNCLDDDQGQVGLPVFLFCDGHASHWSLTALAEIPSDLTPREDDTIETLVARIGQCTRLDSLNPYYPMKRCLKTQPLLPHGRLPIRTHASSFPITGTRSDCRLTLMTPTQNSGGESATYETGIHRLLLVLLPTGYRFYGTGTGILQYRYY